MQQITINTTKHNEVVDITEEVNEILSKSKSEEGLVNITTLHTTCALTTADLDPGTDEDLLEAVTKMFPEGNWRHGHNPGHVGEHIMSSLIGMTVTLPYKNKKLILGTWQRVILVELSGPRQRELIVSAV
ncbi:MAG TPA: secondary thiamine-phosphate synthase enzyme YjbQ [Candidatus Saccharimonadales bacterium]|nr:secondary thiamine-phosphate synthase enzyme YjbQ [Candidatus Saccharimonadales bacterium]